MEALQHYRIKIEALSPIHIGNGEKIGKKEYIYLPWDQLVIVPDINRMYGDLQKKGKGQEFIDYMLRNKVDALGSWLGKQGYQKKDYQAWERYELAAGDAFLTKEARAKDILCFIKDPYGLPYVPGSSLKGMIRTALLAWETDRDPVAYDKIRKDIRVNVGQGKRKTLLKETQKMEEIAFHIVDRGKKDKSDAVCCDLSGLIIGDSDPISPEHLVLTQKIDHTLEGKDRPLPILREALSPGTDIYFDLTIDTKICPYSIEDILDALSFFQQVCYEFFYKRFKRGSKRTDVVWLGGGAGFLSKTVLYPLFGVEAYKIADKVFQATLGKNYVVHKHQKDTALRLSPHTCKCTRYNGELYDMGMGRIEVLSP